MSSASPCKVRGGILVLTLMLLAVTTALSLAGLERTAHQSQLAAALARRSVLQLEAANALAAAAADGAAQRSAPAFVPGCPPQCDWGSARRASAGAGVTAAYIVQRAAPERFSITARATHPGGGEAVAHGLFDSDAGVFRFLR